MRRPALLLPLLLAAPLPAQQKLERRFAVTQTTSSGATYRESPSALHRRHPFHTPQKNAP